MAIGDESTTTDNKSTYASVGALAGDISLSEA